jgi:hypothetical protein
LTPEEWVRQHFINYLTAHKKYPRSLLANEVTLSLNGTSKRCDTVLYAPDLSARMVVEYKAPKILLTQAVFDQVMRYNTALHVEYLCVSNGLQHVCCRIDYSDMSYRFLPEIPDYDAL